MSQDARNKTLREARTAMLRAGLSREAIVKRLASEYGVQTLTNNGGLGVTPSSNNGQVNMGVPEIFFDTCREDWTVWAWFNWPNFGPIDDDVSPFCHDPCAVGGEDGFGLALSRNARTVSGYEMITYGRRANSYFPISDQRAFPSDANISGVTFTGIDHYKFCDPIEEPPWCARTTPDYGWNTGEISLYISRIGCGLIQAFSKYAHTWSNTSVTGFGVAPWSLSVQWSSSANRWERASNPSRAIDPCHV